RRRSRHRPGGAPTLSRAERSRSLGARQPCPRDPSRSASPAFGGRPMRVLISAYACEPGKGSEPGAGWNLALAAARSHDVWVRTRRNNRQVIEAALSGGPGEPRFVYLDLPVLRRRWVGTHLYYAIWQLLAARE